MLRHVPTRSPFGAFVLALLSMLLLSGAATPVRAQFPKQSASPAALLPGDPAARPEDALWTPMRIPTGEHGPSFVVEHLGQLALGGNFQAFGRTRALGAVSWDGSTFTRLGTPKVRFFQTMVDQAGVLYASQGKSGPAVHEEVFRWNGTEWDSIATADGSVVAICVHQGKLTVVGNFTVIGGVAANHAAMFDGTSWTAMGAGPGSVGNAGSFFPIVSAGGSVYAHAIPGTSIMRFDGTSWTDISTGVLNNQVNDLATDGVDLYASGLFTQAGPDSCPGVARWDGTAWHRVGVGGPNVVNAITWWNGHLVAGIADGTSQVSMLVAGHWQGLGDALGIGVIRLFSCGTRLAVRAEYRPPSGAMADVRVFDGVTWTDVADSWGTDMTGSDFFNTAGLALNDLLYVSGSNRTSGNVTGALLTHNVAAWNGTHWASVGGGISGQPLTLGRFGTDLVAGGSFFGPTGGRNIASWNGSAWTGYGTSPSYVWAARDYLGGLYEGTDTGVQRYIGSTWAGVGALGGITEECLALEQWNGMLVAGGVFTSADNQPSAHVAAWDGAAWHPLGSGLSSACAALTVFGGDLVAGGAFTQAGGQPVSAVARWDGAQWSAMGTRALNVWSFTTMDDVLYGAGAFRHPDGEITETVARWTGDDWQPLGSGLTALPPPYVAGDAFGGRGSIQWLAGYHGDLYIGGQIPFAFGQVTSNLMRLPNVSTVGVGDSPGNAALTLAAAPNPAREQAKFEFALPRAGRVRLVVHDLAGRVVATLADGSYAAGRHALAWTLPARPGMYFARLQAPNGETRIVRVVRLE